MKKDRRIMLPETFVKELDQKLKDSGIVTMVQDFMREHPEYWSDCMELYDKPEPDKICTCNLSVCCVNNKDAIPNAVPFITVDVGSYKSTICMLWDHTLQGGTFSVKIERASDSEVQHD
jgi:hypothetical protein